MTEQTSDASASSAPSPSDSIIAAAKAAQGASQAPSLSPLTPTPPTAEVVVSASAASDPTTAVASDISSLFARITALESSIHPRLEAVEDAIESLAKRATLESSPAISSDLEELQHAVHSLGGGLIGHTGHDAGAFFHSWWKKIAGSEAPTPAPIPTTVVNPLANNGASIPLSGK